MSIPHRNVGEALQDLGQRMILDDDGPHVAFVVAVMPDGRPTMWVAQRDGTQHHIEQFCAAGDPRNADSDTAQAPWQLPDLRTAAGYLWYLFRHTSEAGDIRGAHRAAIRSHDDRVDDLLTTALRDAARQENRR